MANIPYIEICQNILKLCIMQKKKMLNKCVVSLTGQHVIIFIFGICGFLEFCPICGLTGQGACPGTKTMTLPHLSSFPLFVSDCKVHPAYGRGYSNSHFVALSILLENSHSLATHGN